MNSRSLRYLALCAVSGLVSCVDKVSPSPASFTYASAGAVAAHNGSSTQPGGEVKTAGVSLVTKGNAQLCLGSRAGVASIVTCDDAPGSHWTFSGGRLRSDAGQCLDVQSDASNPNAPAVVADCATDASHATQLWTYHEGLLFSTSTVLPSRCLFAPTGQADGAALILQVCDTSAVAWTVGPEGIAIADTSQPPKCLRPAGDPNTNGTHLQSAPCSPSDPTQRWTLEGSQLRLLASSNKCLDLNNHEVRDGAPLQLWDCNAGANQAWFYDGNFRFDDAYSDCVVESTSGGATPPIVLQACSGSQAWQLSR